MNSEQQESTGSKINCSDSDYSAMKDTAGLANYASENSRDRQYGCSDFLLADQRKIDITTWALEFVCALNAQEDGEPIDFISDEWLKFLGKHREEVLRARWDSLLVAENDLESRDEIANALISRRAIVRAVLMRDGEGVAQELKLHLRPLFDRNRRLLNYLCCAMQISDSVGSAAAPCDVSTILDRSSIVERNGSRETIVAASAELESLTGFPKRELDRSPFDVLFGPMTCEKDSIDLGDTIATASRKISTLLLYKKDGTPFWATIHDFPISRASGAHASYQFVRLIADVTADSSEKLGQYVLGRFIGKGASGVVRIAKEESSGVRVAIKSVDATKFRSIAEIELVQDEIGALSSVKHENIINLREVIFQDHIFYFVMDFASGGSLAEWMRSNDRAFLDEKEAVKIFAQVLAAVSYCHRRRVIHRDLKPENILLDALGRIQVADFGLSAIAAPCGGLTDICGTPEFLAPEVLSTTEYDGAAADIWSLGVILHELLTGSTPFKGNCRSSLFKAIQSKSPEPLPQHLSSACRDLIARMLIKDPNCRITMEEILAHPWLKSSINDNSSRQLANAEEKEADDDREPMYSGAQSTEVHESAKLTLGDWDSCGDDAIANAIVSGDYSRSPSIVIVRSSQTSDSIKKLSDDLEALRASEARQTENSSS